MEAFTASDVIVSTAGTVHSTGPMDDSNANSDTAPLQSAIENDKRPDGKLVWTPLVAISLLIWFCWSCSA